MVESFILKLKTVTIRFSYKVLISFCNCPTASNRCRTSVDFSKSGEVFSVYAAFSWFTQKLDLEVSLINLRGKSSPLLIRPRKLGTKQTPTREVFQETSREWCLVQITEPEEMQKIKG